MAVLGNAALWKMLHVTSRFYASKWYTFNGHTLMYVLIASECLYTAGNTKMVRFEQQQWIEKTQGEK